MEWVKFADIKMDAKQLSLTKELASKWKKILEFMEERFDKKPDVNGILFLVGIREAVIIPEKKLSKEQKIYLMHVANCKILSYSGYYKQVGFNEDGWPIWENEKNLPHMDLFEQEVLLKQHIIEYFENEEILEF